MHIFENIISTAPNNPAEDINSVTECIDACVACELACVACADACLEEDEVAMFRKCIRLDLDCADICGTAARLLSRLSGTDIEVLEAQLEACALACTACRRECDQHAQKRDHCKVCADACRRCENACRQLLRELDAVAA